MNVRTLKTELDPGFWIVDVPFQTGLVVWLAKPISSAFFRFRDQVYCDSDFVDEEDEARSSSGLLILALGCEISATLEPHLEQNLSPGLTLAY